MTRTEIIGASIPTGVFAGTFLFRWVTLDFDNDYFMHVAWAAEMLRGEWPVRDFVEPGFILQTFVSYAGLRAGGYQLAWEGAAASALIALSATFVYLTCRRIGIPRGLALLAVVLAVASYPRLYAYPKAVVYPAALWAMAVYIGGPTRRALLLLSAITAAAFLFRHDHGVWIGIVMTAGLLIVHGTDLRAGAKAAARYAFVAVFLVAPWLMWVVVSGQAGPYFGFLTGQSQGLVTNRIVPDRTFEIDRSMPVVAMAPIDLPRIRIRWAADAPPDVRLERARLYGLEPLPEIDEYRLANTGLANVRALVEDPAVEDTSGIDRSTLRVPSGMFPWMYLQLQQYLPLVRVRVLPGVIGPANAQAWLTWVTFVLPWIVLVAVLVAAAVSRRGGRSVVSDRHRGYRPLIVSAALLSLVTYQTIVRGSPDSRLGDVAAVTALLLAWTTWRAWTLHGWPRLALRPVAIVLIVSSVAAATSYGQVIRRLGDAGIDGPTNFLRRAGGVGTRYGARPLDLFAPPGSAGLAGLARWLNECTHEQDRVSVIGFEPQIFVYSERGFAGGMAFYDLGWASSDQDQRNTIERWARQQVPIILAMESEWSSFSRDYPMIRSWIDQRYDIERQSAFGGQKALTVLRNRSLRSVATHEATELPCFVGQEV